MNILGITRRIVSSSLQITQFLNATKNQKLNVFAARSLSLTASKFEEGKYDINEDVNKKLLEFFDDKKNWNENEVKHGRSWRLDELRIKSNEDLHKIWYVLLKERNMLKTMEHEYKREWKYWASPERIDKVEESMANIETVVKERNRAYYQLETGFDFTKRGRVQYNAFGLKVYREYEEHAVPKAENKKWIEENKKYFGFAVRKFLRLYREKQFMEKKKELRRGRNHIIRLLRRNPNIDEELLQEKYPHVNIETLRNNDKVRGHYVPKVD